MQQGTVTIIGLDDPEAWEAAAAEGLPSHSWHYAAGYAKAGLDPALAIVEAAGARMILPFHRRVWGEHVDVATLAGLSGALVLPAEADARPLFETWRAHALEQGWVTGYLQLSPRNPDIVAPAGDRIAAHNALFEFDLRRWHILTHVTGKGRYTLLAGDRMGAHLVTEGEDLKAAVLGLYPAAMRRLNGVVIPTETIRLWLEDPGVRLFGAVIDGRIEAIELGRQRGDQAELHLAGSSETGRHVHAWLVWQAVEWFRGQGVRDVNIGEYMQRGDGLHDMKRRMGTIERPLRSLRQVYRPDVFARLCADAGADPDQLYFPAYRVGARQKPPARMA
jgi:hypothetical protein